MVDECRIDVDPDGPDQAIDPDTLEFEGPSDREAWYEGPCRLGNTSTMAQRAAEAGRTKVARTHTLSLPLALGFPPLGALVTITAVHAEGDAALVGERLRVSGQYATSLAVHRKVDVMREADWLATLEPEQELAP